MTVLSVTLVIIMVPRIYGSWLQFKEYSADGDMDKLSSLQAHHNEWILRHLFMALLALGFVTAMKYLPELAKYSQTADVTAVYCVISFTFAFVESLLAQKISIFASAALQPAKPNPKTNRYY